MGSGCSSPIRRLVKPKRHSSASSDHIINDVDNNSKVKLSKEKLQEQASKSEVLINSDITDDNPSSASYVVDSKSIDTCKNNEIANADKNNLSITLSIAKANERNGKPPIVRPLIDRHLLVSPALSPTPSICHSPSPASIGSTGIQVPDIDDLNEIFKIITLGCFKTTNSQRFNDAHHSYCNLIQSESDLVRFLTVILIADADFHYTSNSNKTDITEELLCRISINLKLFCDEHRYNLRIVNLSFQNMTNSFCSNNIVNIANDILKRELKQDNEQIMIIVLSQNSSHQVNDSKRLVSQRFFPTKIDSFTMSRLLNNLDEEKLRDEFKDFYVEKNESFYLKPLQKIYPNIDSNKQRWETWMSISNKILESFIQKDKTLVADVFISLFESLINQLIGCTGILRTTLLVRNFSCSIEDNNLKKDDSYPSGLNRLLSDPNQMIIKKELKSAELLELIANWINDHAMKFADGAVEQRASSGKHKPPYIDINLFTELSIQRHKLEEYLERSTQIFKDVSKHIYKTSIKDLVDLTLKKSLADSPTKPSEQDKHLVFIEGPRGCGKSLLMANLIEQIHSEINDTTQVIYRFSNVSLDSLSMNRIIRSICEQFCQLQGENITAASYIYSNRREIMNALNKILQEQAFFIFIDNLESLPMYANLNLDWLGEIDSNNQIKIFITLQTGSPLNLKLNQMYPNATKVKVNHLETLEWINLVKSMASVINVNLQDDITNKITDSSKSLNLTYNAADELMRLYSIRCMTNEFDFSKIGFEEIQNILSLPFEHSKEIFVKELLYTLQNIMISEDLATLFIILDSSRNGLSEFDILNILKLASSNEKNFSTPWYYLKILLDHWIVKIVHGKTIKFSFDINLSSRIIDHYTKNNFPNLTQKVRDCMIEYFMRQSPEKQTKLETIPLDKSDHMTLTEKIWSATRTSELINLSILLNPIKAKEQLLNKNNFFNQFLYGSMPEEFIEDYEKIRVLATKKSSNFEDLSSLIPWVYASIYPLRYDGGQIYSQIYCRSFESIKNSSFFRNKKLSEIYNIAACPPKRSLLPLSETSINLFIKSRIGGGGAGPSSATKISTDNSSAASIEQTNQKVKPNLASNNQSSVINSKPRIFVIKDNHRHVIVIFPDKNLLIVFDIYEEKAVRTLTNLDSPNDLRMIDQKRAVILCNRNLLVYDLDSGEQLKKLKGVMNQAMPYFEVFDANYVIALSRNRMYVNMLNINTGELETTFKVGEDRFLNSLLLSNEGGICVCGDETQKPFPLLVWNLNERRLMYDLRLNRHEFITKMSAISDDGHFVVSVCRQIGDNHNNNDTPPNTACSKVFSPNQSGEESPNFIVVYDLNSGTLFKKWKPGINTCSVAISTSSDSPGVVANGLVDGSIIIWDLTTGSRRHNLYGHKAPPVILKTRRERLFSMDSFSKDQSLRVWDMDQGHCLAVFTPDAPVASCQISTCGNALVCGFIGEKRLCTLVMCKNETVNDVLKRNKRRKSSKSLYVYDEPQPSRKTSGA